jgi:ribosomal protein L11 methyltransferase
MDYIKLKCAKPAESVFTDILIADLAEAGFESFEETEDALLAYIPKKDFEETKLAEIDFHSGTKPVWELIKDQNWNAVWESNYNPVLIENKVFIRAPFHESRNDVEYEIVINPKMAFGTAHHETTALMIGYLLDEQNNIKGKSLLDMGCGTGVLAILAAMQGAGDVLAVDNDKWSYDSTVENIEVNNTPQVKPVLGDASSLPRMESFDYVFANINKNILLNDMDVYVRCLKKGGQIWFSGFYEADLEDIKKRAVSLGLKFLDYRVNNIWTAAKFIKQN